MALICKLIREEQVNEDGNIRKAHQKTGIEKSRFKGRGRKRSFVIIVSGYPMRQHLSGQAVTVNRIRQISRFPARRGAITHVRLRKKVLEMC